MKLILLFLFAINSNAATIEDVSKKIGICLQNGQNPTVAVMDFEYINKTDVVSPQIVQERVTTALSRSKKVTIVERNLIEKVLKELSSQASGMLGPQETTKLGQMLNADYVLTGTLTDLENNQVEINARVISVASSTVSCAERVVISKDWKTSIILPQDSEINKLPENIKSQIELANFYLVNNAPEKSIEIFSDLLSQTLPSIDSIKWELYLGRAHAYSIKYDSAAALGDADKVVSLKPNLPQGYALRGLIYSRLNPRKYNYAIAEFSQAIKNAPDDQVLYALRANSELASWRFIEARKDFQLALSTKPVNSTIKPFLFYMRWDDFGVPILANSTELEPLCGYMPSLVNSWFKIDQEYLDYFSTCMPEKDMDYYTDIHTKIALTYALEKDSASAISYIAKNFQVLPREYAHAEAIFSIYFGLNNYSNAINLCTKLEEFGGSVSQQRQSLIVGCSAAYRAEKKYSVAITTLEPIQKENNLWGMAHALKYLYLHEAGKSNIAISDIKTYKGNWSRTVFLVSAIINFEIGKKETAKKLFNLYMQEEYSAGFDFWNEITWPHAQYSIGTLVWESLTEKEQNSATELYKMAKKEGPISKETLETFNKEYFR